MGIRRWVGEACPAVGIESGQPHDVKIFFKNYLVAKVLQHDFVHEFGFVSGFFLCISTTCRVAANLASLGK